MSDDVHPAPASPSDAPLPPGRGLSRRELMAAGFFGVLGSQLLLHGTPAPAAATTGVQLAGDGYTIRGAGGTVSLVDGAGTVVQRFRGYRLGSLNLTSGTSVLGAAEDGTPAVVVTWDVPATATGASVRGTFVPRGGRLEIVYDVVSPGATSGSNGMMRRETATAGTVVETFHGVADWARDPRGGIPYQTGARTLFAQALAGTTLYVVAPGGNSTWRDNGALHLPATTVADGTFRAVANVVLAAGARPVVVDALATGRPLAADVWTDRPYNIWSQGGALTVHGVARNGRATRAVTFAWVAHDFDGQVVAQRTQTVVAGPGATVTDDAAVTLPGRGIAFVELTVSAGGDTEYARTNIAVLPPHQFTDTAETSMFGLAADYLFGPAEERELIRRMGVRHSRHAHFTSAELDSFGFRQHRLRTPASPEEFDGDPAALAAYVSSELDLAEQAHATHYECANEWNMRGGVRQGVGAEKYVTKWATAFRAEIDRRGSDIKLIAVGLAGMDDVYAAGMFSAGLAQQAHVFNLHPGRGNVTPDWAPTPDQWGVGASGSYWNFYGALTEARRQIDQHAGPSMALWLTETYAPTKPNSWWEDTYRTAAENTLLSCVLAPTQGVDVLQWFQLYDNRKVNPYGASAADREYHFGLILRDRSPKPSLLAYATAAEHLDGADFVRWLELDDPAARGLLYDTPRGPLAVLWSRADGYTLNRQGARDGGFFPAPEPWVDVWPTKTAVQLPAAGTVTEVDAIGRSRQLPVSGGQVAVTLDGAARLYYGLDLTAA